MVDHSDNALVSDIGGTTTDIAVLRDGLPAIDLEGAKVGPYRTMAQAVAMRTFGWVGQEVHFVSQGLQGGVTAPAVCVSLPQRLTPTLFTRFSTPSCAARCLAITMPVLYAALMFEVG